MHDGSPHYLIESDEDYAAYWSAVHVSQLGNPHAVFYNPLQSKGRFVSLEIVYSGLALLFILIVWCNLIEAVIR